MFRRHLNQKNQKDGAGEESQIRTQNKIQVNHSLLNLSQVIKAQSRNLLSQIKVKDITINVNQHHRIIKVDVEAIKIIALKILIN